MANKIVTKKLTTTTGTALCFDMIAEKPKELHFDFEGKLSERQIIKKFAENYGSENLNLLKLKNIENGQRIYKQNIRHKMKIMLLVLKRKKQKKRP